MAVVDESIASDIANICGLEKVPNPFVALRYVVHYTFTCSSLVPNLPTYIICHPLRLQNDSCKAVSICVYLYTLAEPGQ